MGFGYGYGYGLPNLDQSNIELGARFSHTVTTSTPPLLSTTTTIPSCLPLSVLAQRDKALKITGLPKPFAKGFRILADLSSPSEGLKESHAMVMRPCLMQIEAFVNEEEDERLDEGSIDHSDDNYENWICYL